LTHSKKSVRLKHITNSTARRPQQGGNENTATENGPKREEIGTSQLGLLFKEQKKTQIGNNNDCCITALVLMTGGMRLFLGG